MKRYRVEIISNQSVEEDIVEILEDNIPSLEYTILPTVHGKGLHSKNWELPPGLNRIFCFSVMWKRKLP